MIYTIEKPNRNDNAYVLFRQLQIENGKKRRKPRRKHFKTAHEMAFCRYNSGLDILSAAYDICHDMHMSGDNTIKKEKDSLIASLLRKAS